MARLGFVGLGVMGAPMAGHLIRAGSEVKVWNRTAAKAEPLRAEGARVAADLADLASTSDIVLLCVSRSEDVRACVDAMAPTAAKGTLFVDHSTISPNVAIEISQSLGEAGLRFVDAPVTGGSVGAQKGQLTIFLGGSEADAEEARQAIVPYTKRAERVGGPGAGQMAKLANQIAVGGALLALCESLSFAKKAGLDVAQIRELVAGGAGGSWAFENYGPKILANDWTPGFSIVNQRKDFGYCQEAAQKIDAAIPGTDLVDRLLARLEEKGNGEWTTAALYEEMMRMGAGG
jgi:3-hydroxyisobutyrate dehydrogenase-like beta-hydroxyacid dehydrogenase